MLLDALTRCDRASSLMESAQASGVRLGVDKQGRLFCELSTNFPPAALDSLLLDLAPFNREITIGIQARADAARLLRRLAKTSKVVE